MVNLLQMEDGTTTWETLFDLKESHPAQCAEFEIKMGIAIEPGCNWSETQFQLVGVSCPLKAECKLLPG